MVKNSQTAMPRYDLGAVAGVILDTARKLFATQGFDGTSMSEIAQRAGVSKANVFHHFTSKHDLYLAALRRACEETAGSLVEADSSGEVNQDLWRFFSSQLRALLKNHASAKLILREISTSQGMQAQLLAENVFATYFTRLVAMVSDGQAEGLLREDFDPALFAYLMVAANVFFFENHKITAYLPGGGFARTPERYSRDVFRLLFQGALTDPEAVFQFMES